MTEILEQFSISLQEWLMNPLFNPFHYLLAAVCAFWLFRRISILRTGGEFWEPFHIVGDILYIHAAFYCIGRRVVTFSEMASVQISQGSGRGGRRYIVKIRRKKGIAKCFMIGMNKRGLQKLEELKTALKKHRVGVKEWG